MNLAQRIEVSAGLFMEKHYRIYTKYEFNLIKAAMLQAAEIGVLYLAEELNQQPTPCPPSSPSQPS